MELSELYEAYKAKKLAFEQAKKEEEKYKKLLKDAMQEAGEKEYTDQQGYLFERIVQERKNIDEANLIYVGQRIYIPPYEEDKSVYKEKDSAGKYCLDDDLPPMGGFHD